MVDSEGTASGAYDEIENIWINMADGVRLAARMWLPQGANDTPVPAILEYLPYRKRDFTRSRDEPIHRYFAGQGYASLRVDVRGSGDSEGLLEDEYSQAELNDGKAIIAWLAEQSWCSGKVGMFGISWGGFNALQVAALRPPALKAVISLCASDDRYADDAHYMGGCLLNENLQWGAVLTLNQALPPDPEIIGDGWREMWAERLEHLPAFPARWMEHAARDDFWQHGSVCEDFDRIECPVYAIGGWADGYSNAVRRLLDGLSVPRKGLIGPWAHNFPHNARPGPEIGFLQEATRWWDRWLKDEPNDIMDGPMLCVWQQDSHRPQPQYEEISGHWVGLPDAGELPVQSWYLGDQRLLRQPQKGRKRTVRSPATTGLRGGEWCGFGVDGEMPRDQRPDDGWSLCFDTHPLRQAAAIVGTPQLTLMVSSDQPVAQICARLCDVAPDGASLRISYGLLNLTHRDGHGNPSAMEPGRWYPITLRCNDLAHRLARGHRLRLALSTAYWPIAWPAPGVATLRIRTRESRLDLPMLEEGAGLPVPDFPAPLAAEADHSRKLLHNPYRRSLDVDLTTLQTVMRLDAAEFGEAAKVHLPAINLDVGHTMSKRYRIAEDDPLSAETIVRQEASLTRNSWKIHLESTHQLRCTAEHFLLTAELIAREGDKEFTRRNWDLQIPRRWV